MTHCVVNNMHDAERSDHGPGMLYSTIQIYFACEYSIWFVVFSGKSSINSIWRLLFCFCIVLCIVSTSSAASVAALRKCDFIGFVLFACLQTQQFIPFTILLSSVACDARNTLAAFWLDAQNKLSALIGLIRIWTGLRASVFITRNFITLETR